MAKQTAIPTTKSFFEILVNWIMSLPTDIKVLIEMIGDDKLDLSARSLAVGTIVYLIAAIGLIPDAIPVLGYIDDVIVLHIALATILKMDPERAEYYRDKYPDTIRVIDDQVQLLVDALGALYSWIMAFVDSLSQRRYRGQETSQAAQSEETREMLFDDAMVYAAKVNIDEETIRTKLLATPPNQITKLLSDGLQKEQSRREQTKEKEVSDPLLPPGRRIRRLLGGSKREQPVEHQEE